MRALLPLATGLLILTACDTTQNWHKAGASSDDVAAAESDCQEVVNEQVAALRAQLGNVQSGSRSQNVVGQRPVAAKQVQRYGEDELRKQERQIFSDCMTGKGFSYVGD